MSQTVVLKVGMSCKGCVGAVERVLSKMEGVESYDVSIEQQKVTVKGNIEPQAVFEKVSKTGKKTEFWKEELEPAKSAPAEVPAVAPPVEALNELADNTKAVPADVATAASDAPKEAVPADVATAASDAPKEAPTKIVVV